MRVLITGYGPFFSQKQNPSLDLLKELKKLKTTFSLTLIELPVEYRAVLEELRTLNLKSFDVILFFGLAASRKKVTIEKVALNIQHGPGRPDNSGLSFDEPNIIDDTKALALESTLNCDGLNLFLNKSSIISELSFHAGTFVCNTTLFGGLSILDGKSYCTFIHLPLSIDIQLLAKALIKYLEEGI